MAKRRLGVGLALAAASGLLYGSITVMSKGVEAHPLAKGALNSLAAAVVLLPFLVRLRVDRRDWPKVLAMGFFGGALAPALLLYGLEEAAASDAGLLLALELVSTAALAFAFLGERVGPRAATGLACLLGAAVAVALATGVERSPGEPQASTALGLLLVGLAALSWGVDNLVSTWLVGGSTPPQLVAAKVTIGALLLGAAWAVASLVGPAHGPAAWTDWASLAAIGTVGVAGGSVLFYHALRRIGAARTAAVNIPVSALAAAAGGSIALREPFGWLHAVAVAFVVAGMVLLWERNPPRTPQDG